MSFLHSFVKAADSLLVKTAGIQQISFPGLRYGAGGRDSLSFSIPFSRVGNLLLIKAKADSTEGNFVLDTGCQGLVLNITYFRHYPTVSDPAAETQGITGTAASATEHTNVRNFGFGSMQEYNVKANMANLGAIENSKGVKVLGLIGVQFLKDCELIIDYAENLLYFHVIAKKEIKTYGHLMLNDTASYHTIPFEMTDSRIIIKTTIAGKKLRFIIDCAAERNVLDSRLPDKIFANFNVTGKVNLVGVGNKKVEAITGNLSSFTIGNRVITDMPVLITNLEKTCFSYGGCVDGILGLDNLSVQKIGFNFATNKMYIWK
ncbi:MAG: retropepsin-like domain-containing protein [Rhizobacter sp.]|nr:retropepsin-like domain-containing protein [Ferruginibacter sp.]